MGRTRRPSQIFVLYESVPRAMVLRLQFSLTGGLVIPVQETKHRFFANHKTRQTSWTDPRDTLTNVVLTKGATGLGLGISGARRTWDQRTTFTFHAQLTCVMNLRLSSRFVYLMQGLFSGSLSLQLCRVLQRPNLVVPFVKVTKFLRSTGTV